MSSMRVAVTGAKGTLGRAVMRKGEALGHKLLPLDLPDYDITNHALVAAALREFKPELVIHSAADTDVDGAESKPDRAFRVNSLGTRNVALACAEVGAAIIYISTNMVFFDESRRRGNPFTELETPCPYGVYAVSKREGEMYVEHLTRRFYIARISWLYGKDGDSFVHKMIRNADEKGRLSVTADEVSTPTYAEDLADALFQLGETGLYGWYHLPNDGECSRYEFAAEIMRLTGREHIPMTPTALSDYKRDAPTAHYSTIKNVVGAMSGIKMRPWQEALADFLSSAPELWSRQAGG